MPTYQLWLTDSRGRRISDMQGGNPLARVGRFSAGRVANGLGAFSAVLPADISPALVRDDNMVQVWRAPDGGRLRLWRPYFIRYRRWFFDNGAEYLEIGGPDVNDILRRRVVAERPGTSVSEKVGTCDDMMKQIVLEAFNDGVNPSPSYGTRKSPFLTVAHKTSSGPIVPTAFPWEPLLTSGGGGVLGELADAARSEGVPIYFDVRVSAVTAQRIGLEFVTFAYQPGRDLTRRVLFSLALGNMENPERIEDAREEQNYIYATGEGEDVDQYVTQAYNLRRVNHSAWGRCEGAVDANNKEDDQVAAAARAALAERNAKVTFFADPVSTEHTTFGRDWDWGDRVSAYYHGEFQAVIESVTLEVADEQEKIEARMEGEGQS